MGLARLGAQAAAIRSDAGSLILPTPLLPCVVEAKVPNSSVLAFFPALADPGDGQTDSHHPRRLHRPAWTA